MVIQRLPYILYRDYQDYGYLTDNRNFGYDTASKSCLQVGDLLLSKTGSIFYSMLSDTPQDMEYVITPRKTKPLVCKSEKKLIASS